MMSMRTLFRAALPWVAFFLVGCMADELRTQGFKGNQPVETLTNPCEGVSVPSDQICSAPNDDGVCAPPSITVRMDANVADTKGDVVVETRTVCLTDRNDMLPDAGTEPDGGECAPTCPSRDGWCGDDDGCGGSCVGSCGMGMECQLSNEGWYCMNAQDDCAWCSELEVCDEDRHCICAPPPEGYFHGAEIRCAGVEGLCFLRQESDCLWSCGTRGMSDPSPIIGPGPIDAIEQVCWPYGE